MRYRTRGRPSTGRPSVGIGLPYSGPPSHPRVALSLQVLVVPASTMPECGDDRAA
jgi:hypothetical protein